MSGNNQNSYAEPKRMILGVGDIYIDGTFVGNLKGKVELHSKREYAYQRPGNSVADIKGEVIGEEIMISAEICDFKVSQLRRALGVVQAVDTSTAKYIQKREVVQLVGTTSVPLAETAVVNATYPAKVMSLDRKTTYVSGTGYKFSGGGIERASAASVLTSGTYVTVEYSYLNASAASIAFGGETKAPPTFRMDYVIQGDNGKRFQITFFRAMTDTDFKMAFSELESGDYTTYNLSIKALVDTSRPEGANMMEIIEEDTAA